MKKNLQDSFVSYEETKVLWNMAPAAQRPQPTRSVGTIVGFQAPPKSFQSKAILSGLKFLSIELLNAFSSPLIVHPYLMIGRKKFPVLCNESGPNPEVFTTV